jgi:hypothetical protein
MKALASLLLVTLVLSDTSFGVSQQSYLGFDRNDYPGDSTMSALRKNFRYTSYWLNSPPGEKQSTWLGKRSLLKQQGFGFLVLFNGRLAAELKEKDPAVVGTLDGKAAVSAAVKEGFPTNVLIFLDQEEGGRLLSEQFAYIDAWTDAVRQGGARAGIYCSGIDVPDGKTTISTARDVVAHEKALSGSADIATRSRTHRQLTALWVVNDQCPPSPGCTRTEKPPSAGFSASDSAQALVWQYVRSPRTQFSAACPKNEDPDGNCYAPGLPHSAATFIDLNTANSPDPSEMP